jgi:HEAT repeat protein
VARLLELTSDESRDVRSRAAGVLGSIGRAAATPATVERLTALLADRDGRVVDAALWAVSRMGTAAATPAAIEALLGLMENDRTLACFRAAWALGELARSEPVEVRLSAFWQRYLDETWDVQLAGRSRRVGDVAREEVERLGVRLRGHARRRLDPP